ncbi:PilZ domain-containing protein [Desulfuromonas sp. TF]|jgi:uncharacterized protein (TIGR02266 family)|uniref:PilZ domain-containing protein n=1 Tax=Desulfuromonas sp. TF TaxID=1232410 RepID=UPI00040B640C|nr:PilZ domain-containing protein [Desulfuromonas sp. TF]
MSEQTSDKPPVGQANQRTSLRSPLLVLKVKVDDGRKFFFGYAKNISRSGMFIATANPREPGSTFQVDIPFPEPLRRTVRCTCEVVWQRQFKKKSSLEPGMGLKFIDLPEADADAIDGWVRNQIK